VQEHTMDISRALSSPNMDICKKAMEIVLGLVSVKNVDEVILLLKKELMKMQDSSVDNSGRYRQLLYVILFIREIMKEYVDLQESILEQLSVSISEYKHDQNFYF
jgi:vesicle coat complex subunit